MPLTMCLITGTWPRPDGVTATGEVVIEPVTEATAPGAILAAIPIVVPLVGGAISKMLVSNTEATALQYRVTELIDGARTPPPTYVITPTGTSLDLSNAPRNATGTVSLYVLASDPRISGALQSTNNLSDLASAPTGRTNLGLGTAAVANKVAAGSTGVLDATDPSTTNPRTPTGAGGGDLGGIFPAPTVIATHLAAPLPIAQGGTAAVSAAAAVAALGAQAAYVVPGTKTANYTATVWQLVPCDATAGSFTVTLPTGAAAGQQITVKLLATAGSNTVTVATGGTDVINQAGITSVTLQLMSESFELTATGSGVWILGGGQKSLSSLDGRFLRATNNLSDVTAAPARTNLGLGSGATAAIDTTAADIAALGTQAAGATGKLADAGHVHPMPRLDQVANPTSSVSMANQKLTSVANGTVPTDGAAFGQVLPATGGTLTGSVSLTSTGTGGPDTSDSTSRINLASYQTNGTNFFGEIERRDLMEVYSKAMTAWRMARPATGRGTDPIVFDTNSSFITDTSGYSTFGGAALVVSTLQHLVGTNSGRINWATGAAGTQGISLALTGLTIGHTYVAYVWAYVEATNPAVHIDIDGTNASAATTVTDAWQRLSTSWVATATSHNLRVLNDGAATSGQRGFVDLIYATSNLTGMRTVVWQGAHYAPQDMSVTIHGHWSVEVPDSSDNLQTRLEVLFTDSVGNIGVDQGLVRIVQAALTVDTNNGNVLRLDAAANVVRPIEWTTNSKWGGGTSQRWQLRANAVTEAGGNAGSNLELARYSDAGVETDQPITVTRSSGRTTIGGASGTASGLTVNRNAAGNTILAANTANGGTGVAFQGNDTTSIALQGSVGAEANPRVKLDLGAKLSFGPGGSIAVDTDLYRGAAGQVKTDGDLVVVGKVSFNGIAPILTAYGPPLLAESFEHGAVGTQADKTNTNFGTNPGDGSDAYAAASAATFVAGGVDGGRAGQIALAAGTGAFAFWGKALTTAQALVYIRVYVLVPTFASNPIPFITTKNGGINGSHLCRLQLGGSGNPGKLQILNDADTVQATSTNVITAGTWFRVEWKIDVLGGAQTMNLYTGANLHTTTPTETLTGAADASHLNVDYLEFGPTANPGTPATYNIQYDAILAQIDGYPGPIMRSWISSGT